MLKRIQHILVLSLLVFTPAMTFAESSIPDYLLEAVDDARAFHENEGKSPFYIEDSWIENAEFRGNINIDLDNKDNETGYEIRFKPKAYGQRGTEQNIFDLRTEQREHTYKKALNNALYTRYRRLLDLMEKRNKARYSFQYIRVIQQETQFYRNLAQGRDFKARKLLDAEISLEKMTGLANLQLSHLNFTQKKMDFPSDSSTSLRASEKMFRFISFSETKKIMNQSLRPLESPDVLASRLDFKLEKSLSQSVEAQQKLGIDLLTFKYDEKRGQDTVSFKIGVNIPLANNFRASESFHDVREAESNLIARLASVESLLLDYRNQFQFLSLERDFIRNHIERLVVRMSKPYAMSDPELLFVLKYEHIRQEQDLSETKLKVLHVYLDFLRLSGILGKQPLRNWIQEGHPLLIEN